MSRIPFEEVDAVAREYGQKLYADMIGLIKTDGFGKDNAATVYILGMSIAFLTTQHMLAMAEVDQLTGRRDAQMFRDTLAKLLESSKEWL